MNERMNTLLTHLTSVRFATVTDLADLLGISTVTVRRYLDELEQAGMVKRTRGGAFINEGLDLEPSFGFKQNVCREEKRRIAAAAVDLIEDGDAIALNAGTTTWEIARLLHTRQDLNLTVLTNSISVAATLSSSPGIRLVVTGGICRERSQALVGAVAERTIQDIFVDKAFLGVNGFSLAAGLTTPNMEEARVNRAMMRAAKSITVVADHSKFDKVSFSLIAPVREIHRVITDQAVPEDTLAALRSMHIDVITV